MGRSNESHIQEAEAGILQCLCTIKLEESVFIIHTIIHTNGESPVNKRTTEETVVQLSKGNISSQNVRVEFSLEDMDMSRFQQGATYEEIQAWVQEKYGFHVTHLNIAQVKRKHGIIERENYNKPKSPDSRQRGCPEDKTKAIE